VVPGLSSSLTATCVPSVSVVYVTRIGWPVAACSVRWPGGNEPGSSGPTVNGTIVPSSSRIVNAETLPSPADSIRRTTPTAWAVGPDG